MGKVERDGDTADAIRGEPFVRQPVVGTKDDMALLELGVEVGDPLRQGTGFDCQTQIAHPEVEQLLVRQ